MIMVLTGWKRHNIYFCYVTQFGGDSPWNHIHTFHCQDSSNLKILFESLQLGFTLLDI
jgi:hypothetical protein